MGMNSIAHPALNVHCLCTDDVANSLQEGGAVAIWEAVPAILKAAGL